MDKKKRKFCAILCSLTGVSSKFDSNNNNNASCPGIGTEMAFKKVILNVCACCFITP